MTHRLLSILIRLADVMFGDESDDEAKGTKKEYTYNPRKEKPAKTRRKKASEYGDGVVLKKDAPPESGTTEVADRRASRKGKKEGEENSANDNNTKASRCDKKVGAPHSIVIAHQQGVSYQQCSDRDI